MKRLVLIDGHAILHRAYHAFPTTLRTRKGEIVNAVYGFTRILLTVLKDLHPEYAAVAFDRPEPTFRHKEYVGYQVQRPAMEKELKDQINRVKEVVRSLNIPIFERPGYEADDIIGTLASQAGVPKFKTQKSKLAVIIVTGDKDIMQLIDKNIKIYLPQKGFSEIQLCGEKEVEEILGIKPSQVVDYKALVGDSSDNYPGVSGIGPKTAVRLLMAYGDLDNIYKNINKLPTLVTRKLTEGKEAAELSKKLAQIVISAPVRLDLKACKVHDYDRGKAIKLFQELEFRSLIDKLPGVEKNAENKKKNQQIKLF